MFGRLRRGPMDAQEMIVYNWLLQQRIAVCGDPRGLICTATSTFFA